MAIGLAWTPVGGDVLFIEASRMTGSASLTLTGQLGDVMKESARAALSWVRAHAAEWNIDPDFFKGVRDPPARAVGSHPQGRSVGGRHDGGRARLGADPPARAWRRGDDRRDHALGQGAAGRRHQGEGAGRQRLGIREIILPRQNEKNVKEDLDDELRAGLTLHLVGSIDEVLLLALVPVRGPVAKKAVRRPQAAMQ